jgi:hypothetical protein
MTQGDMHALGAVGVDLHATASSCSRRTSSEPSVSEWGVESDHADHDLVLEAVKGAAVTAVMSG